MSSTHTSFETQSWYFDNGIGCRLPVRFKSAFAILVEAVEYAEQTNGNTWDFAIEIDRLRSLGISENDLRFLVRLELVDHASERTVSRGNGRQFVETGALSFTPRTCFILTPTGITATAGFRRSDLSSRKSTTPRLTTASKTDKDDIPCWDSQRSTLSFQGTVVKHFKWQACNQARILAAFQEEAWPAKVDDPLTPTPSLDVKRRLCDTIKCLNRNQVNRLLRFRGDGTGQAVLWEKTVASEIQTF